MKRSPILTILGVIVLILIVIFGCGAVVTGATYAVGYFVRGTRPIPGDASKFDPFASLPQVEQFAGDGMQLVRIDMEYVKSDGTLDLTANYSAQVTYAFAHVLTTTPSNEAPLGAGGSASGGVNAERAFVMLVKPGPAGTYRDQYYNFGMERSTAPAEALTQPIIPAPQCALTQLWQAAIKQGAPANAVAVISYDNSGYDFNIDAANVHLSFDENCQLHS